MRRYRPTVVLFALATAGLLVALRLDAQSPPVLRPHTAWVSARSPEQLPREMVFENALGRLGVLNVSGPIETAGHPFFEPIGSNDRACVTCHQPANAMSVSVESIRERWRVTQGRDPIFAAIDGSNNPSLPQDEASSHSLLLNRGLFRVAMPWPPAGVTPEFSIEVARDPTGVNRDPVYGLHSASPTVSVFRRPRVAANLKYVTSPDGLFNVKLGVLMEKDPDTGLPSSMNIMADARAPSLSHAGAGCVSRSSGWQGAAPASATRTHPGIREPDLCGAGVGHARWQPDRLRRSRCARPRQRRAPLGARAQQPEDAGLSLLRHVASVQARPAIDRPSSARQWRVATISSSTAGSG